MEMPEIDIEEKYKDDNFGENANHGAEKMPCEDCKFRTIVTMLNGKVFDTGRGATCKKYPNLKPLDVMMEGAKCPQYKKDEKVKI